MNIKITKSQWEKIGEQKKWFRKEAQENATSKHLMAIETLKGHKDKPYWEGGMSLRAAVTTLIYEGMGREGVKQLLREFKYNEDEIEAMVTNL